MLNYTSLCHYSDGLLKDENVTEYRIANSWLHIPRKHPNLMEKYNKSSILKLFITYFILQISKIVISFSKNNRNFKYRNCEILLISHYLNANKNSNNDFYFDEISYILNKRYAVGKLFLNHTNNKDYKIYDKQNLITLNKLLNYRIEIMFLIRQLFEMFIILKKAFFIKNKEKKNFYLRAAIEQISPETFHNLRIGINVFEYVKKFNPKYIITTFEGHAWERFSYYMARKAKENLKCIGYQHVVIFNDQFSIRSPLGRKYDPDIIWTSGDIGKKILEEKFYMIQVVNIGTSKYSEKKDLIKNINENILVLPESFISESKILFEFSYIYALKNKNIKFIWRVHPNLTYNIIRKHSKILPNIELLPINIKISNNNFNEDMVNSKYIFYRGSTASIEGYNYGLIPLYLNDKCDLYNINPLIHKNYHCFQIFNEQDLTNSIENKSYNFKNESEYYSRINENEIFKSLNI
jgi:hypothetical protein